jgi:hypothetical protein
MGTVVLFSSRTDAVLCAVRMRFRSNVACIGGLHTGSKCIDAVQNLNQCLQESPPQFARSSSVAVTVLTCLMLALSCAGLLLLFLSMAGDGDDNVLVSCDNNVQVNANV